MSRRFFGFPARSIVTVPTVFASTWLVFTCIVYVKINRWFLLLNTGQQSIGTPVGSRLNYTSTKDGSYLVGDSVVVGTERSGHIATYPFEKTAQFLVTLILALIFTIGYLTASRKVCRNHSVIHQELIGWLTVCLITCRTCVVGKSNSWKPIN